MPIISDIASSANFFLNLIRMMIEKPIIFILFIIMILLFPLNVIDYLLTIFFNIFILLFNVLLFIIIIPVNILYALVAFTINWLINAIASPFIWLLDVIGISWSPPQLSVANINPPQLNYQYIDWFGTNDTLLGLIVNSLGLSLPLFKINHTILNYEVS